MSHGDQRVGDLVDGSNTLRADALDLLGELLGGRASRCQVSGRNYQTVVCRDDFSEYHESINKAIQSTLMLNSSRLCSTKSKQNLIS